MFYRLFKLSCLMLASCASATSSIAHNASELQQRPADFPWNTRSLARMLMDCLSGQAGLQLWPCLERQTERLLDAARQDNSVWQLSDYVSLEPQLNDTQSNGEQRMAPSETHGLGEKLLQLTQSRALRLRMPRETISNAIDDFGSGIGLDQGRKKKDKDKHMAMMGGMIMLATFAQMFLGKVILIAGSAFVMAKIALLVSLLGSLKKGSTGSSPSTDHVIVTSSGGGGHSHESGWHRSMPTNDYAPAQLELIEDRAEPAAYYAHHSGLASDGKATAATNLAHFSKRRPVMQPIKSATSAFL